MRLLSLTVRNYRVHKDLTVTFDPSRNLIGGPNECGKSTLAEAAHRALFLRAKTGGSIQKEMVSTHIGGDPEVLLTFEAAGVRWELEKRFAGTKGSTRLSATGMATLKDEEADAKLSEILKTESGGRANASQLAATWSHLWVWQGSSGQDPADHASAHKDTLVQRLQKDGIAAVMQSATDQRVREKIAASYDELFTATGKPKAGSKPELARAQLAEAEAALARTQETAARLEQAVADHARAEKDIADADAVLPTLKEQRTTTEAKLTQVSDLKREEETRLRALETATATRDQISKADAKIRELHQQTTTARQALQPAEEKETSLTTAEQSALAASKSAETTHREAAEAVRQIRLHHDLATAQVAAFEKSETHQHLATRAAEADTLRAEITDLRTQHSQIPPLTAKELTQLRSLERESSQAAATLAAIATGIELLQSDTPVTLDGQASNHRRIPHPHRHLRTRHRHRHPPPHPPRRRRFPRRRPPPRRFRPKRLVRRPRPPRPARSRPRRHRLRTTPIPRTTNRPTRNPLESPRRRKPQHPNSTPPPPPSPPQTPMSNAARKSSAKPPIPNPRKPSQPPANSSPPPAKNSAPPSPPKPPPATAPNNPAPDSKPPPRPSKTTAPQLTTARQTLRDLETSIKVLEDTHGDAPARQLALTQATQTCQQAADQLATTRAALAALAPASLSADLDRFTRAIAQQEARRREAENQRLIARDRLTLDGSSDPEADLSHAQARCQAARELHASEQRRAKAIEKLHLLFSSSREAIDRSLVQPLADRISGYLQCLFGPGTEVRVNLSDTGIQGLDLIRPGDPAFSFATLSGGAKEQVAAATRLALAEILATDHDGTLPILFDDAFAYTDPERIQSLQRMLDLAAVRGLQIIVLTCTPADYSAFGASEIRLASV